MKDILKILPIKRITEERAKFDIHKLVNPDGMRISPFRREFGLELLF
jgi:hypothetical protein